MSAPKSASPRKINVLIGDGRKLMREGIAMLLQKDGNIRVVGEAEDARAVGKLIGPLGANVVLFILPAGHAAVLVGGAIEMDSVLATLADILGTEPAVKLIVLTSGLSSPDLRQLVRAGAAGCLTMDCSSEELIASVRQAVGGGEVYLSARLREQVARRYVSASGGAGDDGTGTALTAPREPRLAAREVEVLRLIAAGGSTKEIAATLHVGTKTIETHRRRMMEKLNRYSVAELTQYAILKGLIRLPREIEN